MNRFTLGVATPAYTTQRHSGELRKSQSKRFISLATFNHAVYEQKRIPTDLATACRRGNLPKPT
jgi:hypothetical protein